MNQTGTTCQNGKMTKINHEKEILGYVTKYALTYGIMHIYVTQHNLPNGRIWFSFKSSPNSYISDKEFWLSKENAEDAVDRMIHKKLEYLEKQKEKLGKLLKTKKYKEVL
jgi:hypothetical protein